MHSSLFFRYCQFAVGVAFMALGIALTTRADLGTTPISALPYVASLGFAPSLGFYTVAMNLFLIVLQVALLLRNFPLVQLLQIPASFLFGMGIDFWMMHIPLVPDSYLWQLAYLAGGIFTLALGIFIEVAAKVVMMSGEGAVMAIALRVRKDFGTVKVLFDVSLVSVAVLLSFLLFGHLAGVREGTLLSAVAVGMVVKGLFRIRDRLNTILTYRHRQSCPESKRAERKTDCP